MSVEQGARATGAMGAPDVPTSVARVAGTQPPRGRDRLTARGPGPVGAAGGGGLGGLLRIIRLDWVHAGRLAWVSAALLVLGLPVLTVLGGLAYMASVMYLGAGFSLVSGPWTSARRYHLDGLCAALGVRRGEVVAARYLVLLGFLAAAVPVSFLAAATAEPDLRDWLRWVVLTFFMVLSLGCLPPACVSLRRHDPSAVLLAWAACVVGCGLVLGGLSGLVAWAGASWPVLDPDSTSFLAAVACAAVAAGAAALVGSWRFTLRAYARQDL